MLAHLQEQKSERCTRLTLRSHCPAKESMNLPPTGPECSPIRTWVLVVIKLSFHYLVICSAPAVITGCSTTAKSFLHRRYIEPRAINRLLFMLFVPLPSRVKNGADIGPVLLVASTFTLPAPGVILGLVASSATASTLTRCVPSSYVCKWGKLEIGNGNTDVRQGLTWVVILYVFPDLLQFKKWRSAAVVEE